LNFRFDGIFDTKSDAIVLTEEVMALYTNGPAGGGGVDVGTSDEIGLDRSFISRHECHWKCRVLQRDGLSFESVFSGVRCDDAQLNRSFSCPHSLVPFPSMSASFPSSFLSPSPTSLPPSPPPTFSLGERVRLSSLAHSRAGDKHNTVNLSLVPYFSSSLPLLRSHVTPAVVKGWFEMQFGVAVTVSVYRLDGVSALNIVIDNALDGGVVMSRRLDRHGKTLSDWLLMQEITIHTVADELARNTPGHS
jgi:hypothetical protein